MRPVAIWREAWRDITTGTTRTLTYSLLLIVVVIGLGAAEASTVRSITDAAVRYRESGASVITLVAPARIDPRSCEALNAIPGVRAAGALRTSTDTLTPATLPSSTIPVFDVTATLPRILGVAVVRAGVILSDQAAQTLSLDVGEELVTREATTTVAGTYTYPDDGRRAGFAYAALAPISDTGAFDECWVESWPISSQIPALLRLTLLPGDDAGDTPVLSQLNSTLGTNFDGAVRYHARITRFAPVVALAVGVLLGYVALRVRRTPLAAALHAGVSKADLARILTIETFSWVVPAIVALASATAVTAAMYGSQATMVVLAARIGAAAALGPSLGSTAAIMLTRERHLFRYFKDR